MPTPGGPPAEKVILEALRTVHEPDLRRDIVSLKFVKAVEVRGPAVRIRITLPYPTLSLKDQLRQECAAKVRTLPGVDAVEVEVSTDISSRPGPAGEMVPEVRNIVAIASGKGGVGKSTTSANLALALSSMGARVGLLDADVYGPSIPGMLGVTERPEVNPGGRLPPIGKHGISVMSMGLLASRETPVIWRGPMATKLIQQFLGAVEWGALDYLLLDLPPGTGDVQLTITQSVPLAGAVIVSTPQDVALHIAMKGLKMFQDVHVPIVGIVENMSTFVCPHCGERSDIFRHGGARKICGERGIPFLGEIPIDGAIVQAGDEGLPTVLRNADGPAATAYREVARRLVAEIGLANLLGSETTRRPQKVGAAKSGVHLDLKWDDGHRSRIGYRRLRLECPCAACIDEWTREPRLDPKSVPELVHPIEVSSVGRYALAFKWSDGHSSGIYTFQRLRDLCECIECGGTEAIEPEEEPGPPPRAAGGTFEV
ncbi:MAG: P-loop NTPase [Planctomycetes bacterium]|nr:P-loop NTPase [Planctomycetota bacterium]